MYESSIINRFKKSYINSAVQKIADNYERYFKIFQETGVPANIIGLIHMKESSFDFTKHLHNGNPLTGKTFWVPKNRPLFPPANGLVYTFEESSIDALNYQGKGLGLDLKSYVWDLANTLFFLEAYNGFGYRKYGVNTPYLWNFTQHYVKGHFVADNTYDVNAVSKNVGCVAVLKFLNHEFQEFSKNINKEKLLNRFIEVGKSYLGVREEGRNNKGKQVEEFQKAVDGKASGEAWCMAFVQFCLKKLESEFNFLSPVHNAEHCLTVWNNTPNYLKSSTPNVGSIAIWRHGDTTNGHTGIVTGIDMNKKIFYTVEGNTKGTSDINREGDGVYECNRLLHPTDNMKLVGFIRII